MIVYRITLAKYAGKLVSSGNEARWNYKDAYVIYSAWSRSLACLENIVYRNALGLSDNFRVMLIDIPDDIRIDEVKETGLKKNWNLFDNTGYTRSIGDEWIKSNASAVLKVPSAIIRQEFNYILNTAHKDYSEKWYAGTEPFVFDKRIKS